MLSARNLSTNQATLVGLIAPICWGMSVSLVRGIAEGFGLAQGQFFLYCVSTLCVLFTVGMPDFRKIDRRYLLIGIPTANLSSLSFCLAIFTSSGGAQTMEVGMVNYLWPALTILFAVLFNRIGTRWWLYPGLVIAFAGIVVILSGDQGFSFAEFAARFAENPVSYVLALTAAVTWAGYSSMTRAWGGTTNPTTIIFIVDTMIFGILWLFGFGSEPVAAGSAHGIVSVIFGGIAVGAAYAAWTLGMSRGNMAVLAAASYFTPVLSCVFATFWINAELDSGFWSGVALVVAGSLLCWDATGRGMRALKVAGKKEKNDE
ncbi:MAG: aromatic amino acid DMT transporter YddG [Duodenibacillus sp.]|nr:aromatic amino acid DMT transporter YddG [Duodenibacillus sp.]